MHRVPGAVARYPPIFQTPLAFLVNITMVNDFELLKRIFSLPQASGRIHWKKSELDFQVEMEKAQFIEKSRNILGFEFNNNKIGDAFGLGGGNYDKGTKILR